MYVQHIIWDSEKNSETCENSLAVRERAKTSFLTHYISLVFLLVLLLLQTVFLSIFLVLLMLMLLF